MSTFKAFFKKEIIESIRQYKYLIIGLAFLFFAVSDPIMLKLLPSIMKSQMHMNIENFMVINRKTASQNYIKDIFEISNIVVVFSACGILGKEIQNGKFILPFSRGCSKAQMVLAKFFHYSLITSFSIFLGFLINFYYAGILFKGNFSFAGILDSALCIILFFIFNIALTTLLSSIFKKDVISGIAALFISYIMLIFKNVTNVYSYLPVKLIDIADTFSTKGIEKPLIIVIIFSFIFIASAIYRMNKIEVI